MKKIVIIGGGFAGARIAKHFDKSKNFEVVLVDTKDYFEFTPSILRVIVNPKLLKKVQVLHSHYLHRSKIEKGQVTEISEKEVSIGNKKIPFDYLVITSGSRYHWPIKEQNVILPTRADTLRSCYKKLCESKKVLIIGGGLVGVELAAEIIDHYPEKEVILIQSGGSLIPRNHKKSIKYSESFLKRKGVEIILNESVFKKNWKLVTERGREINGDIVFFCIGIKSNSGFLKKNFPNHINKKGQAKVNEFLQLSGYKNIFAAGDIINLKGEKTAQSAEKQAELIIKNIENIENGNNLENYLYKKRPIVISLGKHKGIFEHKNFILTGFIPAIMKKIIEWKTMKKYK